MVERQSKKDPLDEILGDFPGDFPELDFLDEEWPEMDILNEEWPEMDKLEAELFEPFEFEKEEKTYE